MTKQIFDLNKKELWESVKPKKMTFRHYFGGFALLLLISQLVTGLYMIFYYEPSLRETYKTVQYFDNVAFLGALTRNIHRYGAFFLTLAVAIHLWRGYMRRDYQGGRKWNWITGVLLSLIIVAFLISGTILPWEWKGYWMMEMFNNWLKTIPIFGTTFYDFFMQSYTPTRNFVIHDIVLPLLTYILLQIHCLSRLRKRGYGDFFLRQTVATIPLIIAIIAYSVAFPVPTEDPEMIPFPMDGQYIPAPEWFFVTFLLPYWYFPPREWSLYLFWVPFIILVVFFLLPYLNKRKKKDELEKIPEKRRIWMGKAYTWAGIIGGALFVFTLLWGSVDSPWMGCNSCHNVSMGDRMGIPPVTYKDVERNPLLLDNRWMMRHWYEPQVVW
ncbi:MAG: cytochrome b N-terminal domain-containing protein [Nitrospinota bacterium]|nr:cytochrome b N-terminal domain-containing protein [Nitrospinota bacterium]